MLHRLNSMKNHRRAFQSLLAALLIPLLVGCNLERAQVNRAPASTPENQADLPPPSVSIETLVATLMPPTATTVPNTPAPLPTSYPVVGLEVNAGEPPEARIQGLQSGAFWLRRNALLWSRIEPERGQRFWDTQLESEISAASENNLEVILIVRDAPSWAQQFEGIGCGPVKESEFAAFASFLQEAVTRYSQPPFNVKYWELGNEPDVFVNNLGFPFGCWGDLNDPYYGGGYYGKMLQVVYPAIKAANPEAQVLIGGLLLDCNPNLPEVCADPQPARFLEGILQGGYGAYFDGVSFHAYDYYLGELGQYENRGWDSRWNTTGPVLTAKAAFLRAVLTSYGIYDKYLINTESALINTTGNPCDEVCQESKAIYAAQVFTTAVAQNLRGNIWYSLLGWQDSGLLGPSPEFQKLPLYLAFQFASEKLTNAAFIQTIQSTPGVIVFEMQRDSTRLLVAWSMDGSEHVIALPQAPTAVWDMFGSPINGTGSELNITIQPVYIEF